jgi:hypothetical protein
MTTNMNITVCAAGAVAAVAVAGVSAFSVTVNCEW